MAIDQKLLAQISDLVLRTMDHCVTSEEFEQLQHLLKTNPTAREYYFDVLSTYVGMDEIQTVFNTDRENAIGLLEALSDEEKSSPTVEVPKPARIPQDPVKIQPQDIRYIYFEKRRFALLLATVAAALFVVASILFLSSSSAGREVATVSDCMNAEWAETTEFAEKGARLTAGSDSLQLQAGYAELLFDSGVRVVVEAPAEFRILSADHVKLFYGQLYADVPHEAIGFAVRTLNSKIVDLGTEFGIRAEADGSSQVHVLQGKVILEAGGKAEKYSRPVTAGQARRISGFSSQVTDIACREDLFTRRIAPESGIVWRGEKAVSLADIVTGGNGFGTAVLNRGIDLKTGTLADGNNESRVNGVKGYIPVPSLAFVDGVFVPTTGPIQLSSAGHTYGEFDKTNGAFYMPVGVYESINMYSVVRKEWYYDRPLLMQGYSRPVSEALCLHANAGVTFDLRKIREALPFARLRRFSALYGVANTQQKASSITSDFYVFVDGQPRLVRKGVSVEDAPAPVVIELREQDRFLTLACTEGKSNYADWTLFVNPVLELE